nr:GAF domain-containing protein [Anaerolineae bacterium]
MNEVDTARPIERILKRESSEGITSLARAVSIALLLLVVLTAILLNGRLSVSELPGFAVFVLLHLIGAALCVQLPAGIFTGTLNAVLVAAILAMGYERALLVPLAAAAIAWPVLLLSTFLFRRLRGSPRFVLSYGVWLTTSNALAVLAVGAGSRFLLGIQTPIAVTSEALWTVVGFGLAFPIVKALLNAGWLAMARKNLPGYLRRYWGPQMLNGVGITLALSPFIAMRHAAFSPLWPLEVAIFLVIALALYGITSAQVNLTHRMADLKVLNRVGAILNTRLDMDELIRALYDEIAGLVDASSFYLVLYEEAVQRIIFALTYEEGEELPPISRGMGNGLTEHVIRTRQSILLPYRAFEQAQKLGIEPVGRSSRSFLAVPMITEGRVIGVIGFRNYWRDYVYSTHDCRLMETVASAAAVALQNARLYQEAEQRARELDALYRLSALATEDREIASFVSDVCQIAVDAMQSQKAGLFLLEEDRVSIRLAAQINMSEAYQKHAGSMTINTPRAETVRTGKTLIVEDLYTDPRFLKAHDMFEKEHIQAVIEVPLHYGNQITGSFVAYYDHARVFESREITFLETLGSQIGLTIENARLKMAEQERQTQLETLVETGRLVNASLYLPIVLRDVAASMIRLLEVDLCITLLSNGDGDRFTELYLTRAGNKAELPQHEAISLDRADLPGLAQASELSEPVVFSHGQVDGEELACRLLARFDLQSGVVLPLTLHGETFGAIVIGKQRQAEPFTPTSVQLARALSDQATLAIQNARLYSRTDVELSRRIEEITALEAITQRMSRRLDLDAVIRQIVQAARDATGARYGEVALLNESTSMFQVVSQVGSDQEYEEWPADTGLTGRSLGLKSPVNVGNVSADPDYLMVHEDVRSELVVPIVLDEARLGVINLSDVHLNAFDENQTQFVENLAKHAAIAIQNARLYEAARLQADEFSYLRDVAIELLSSYDLDHALQIVARAGQQRTQSKDIHIYLYDSEQDRLTFGTSLLEDGSTDRPAFTPRQNGLTYTVARSGEKVVVLDLPSHPLFKDSDSGPWKRVGAIVGIPLKRGEETIGVFNLAFRRPADLDDAAIRFLELLATQAAFAISRAYLYESEHHQREVAVTLFQTSSAIASTLDLGQVLLTLAEQLTRISGLNACVISGWDEKHEQLVLLADYATICWSEDMAVKYDTGLLDVQAAALAAGEPAFLNYRDLGSSARVAPVGVAAELAVPVLVNGQPAGVLSLGWLDPPDHMLVAAVRQDLESMGDVVSSYVRAVLSQQDSERVCEYVRQLLDRSSANSCLISGWNREADTIRPVFDCVRRVWGWDRGVLYGDMPELIEGDLPAVVHTGAADGAPSKWSGMRDLDLPAKIYIPLVHKGQRIGLVELYDIQGACDVEQETLDLLRVIAEQASVAIANAHLADQIRTARDSLEAILNSSHDGIIMFDMEGYLVLCNPRSEWLLGVPITPYIGQHFLQIVRQSRAYKSDEEVFRTHEVMALLRDITARPALVTRRTYKLHSPALRVIEEVTVPVLDAEEQAIGRLVILHDITRSYEVDLYREELSRMIVHDLRSPLAGVITGLMMAHDELDYLPESEARSNLEITVTVALEGANAVYALVEEILTINKLEAGEMPLDLTVVNLKQLVSQALRVLKTTAHDADVALIANLPEDCPAVRVDPDKIGRVLTNLLDNALRYTPSGGEIRVAAETQGLMQRVSVTDTGPGITAEERSRIFDRFYQGDVSRRQRGPKGSGLGLTFCRLAIESHGGRIWVEDGPEGGAAFFFEIPLAGEPAEGVSPAAQ